MKVGISKDVNYDLRQYALWVEACVNEHGGSGALAAWEQIEKVVNAHDALVAALEAVQKGVPDVLRRECLNQVVEDALALARGG